MTFEQSRNMASVQEVEREEEDLESGKRGKKRKVQELEYCYEQEMEGN